MEEIIKVIVLTAVAFIVVKILLSKDKGNEKDRFNHLYKTDEEDEK